MAQTAQVLSIETTTPCKTQSTPPLGMSKHFPPLMGLARLMTGYYQRHDMDSVAQTLLLRCQQNYSDTNALLDLNTLLQLRGDLPTALHLQNEAFKNQQAYTLNPDHKRSDIKVLALMAAGELLTNTPFEFLALGAGIELTLLYIDVDGHLPEPLPKHDVAIVAVCELDKNHAVLSVIEQLIKQWPRPVLNPPRRIMQMSRDINSLALQQQAGIEMPATFRINREQLMRLTEGERTVAQLFDYAAYPLIIRPLDSHAGLGLQRVDDAEAVATYLQEHDNKHFFVSPFYDYADADGLYRKFRIVLMAGKPYLAHMAISENWMVHYLNAGMTESAHKRDIEAEQMLQFEQQFAQKHAKALNTIHAKVGTDYFALDCSETAEGKLLIFEVGTSMLVHDMDSHSLFAYKAAQMQHIFNGFREFLQTAIKHEQ